MSSIYPHCLAHGLLPEQHEYGRCLFCCICFVQLTPDECWADAAGQKWDLCIACGENEAGARPDEHDACPKHEEAYRICGCPVPSIEGRD